MRAITDPRHWTHGGCRTTSFTIPAPRPFGTHSPHDGMLDGSGKSAAVRAIMDPRRQTLGICLPATREPSRPDLRPEGTHSPHDVMSQCRSLSRGWCAPLPGQGKMKNLGPSNQAAIAGCPAGGRLYPGRGVPTRGPMRPSVQPPRLPATRAKSSQGPIQVPRRSPYVFPIQGDRQPSAPRSRGRRAPARRRHIPVRRRRIRRLRAQSGSSPAA